MEDNIEKNIQNNMQSNLGYSVENNVPNNVDYNPANNMPNNMQYNMNYNAGNNMGNPMPGQKNGKGGLIALWIVLGIVALVVIGIVIAIVVKNVAHDNEINTYKTKIEQYLYSKYNEEFDIEYINEEYGKELVVPCGNSTLECVRDHETKHYYFDAKSKGTNIEVSVKFTKHEDKGTEQIEDYNKFGFSSNSQSETKAREVAKSKIESELAKNYSSYKLDVEVGSTTHYVITINENFPNQADKLKTFVYNTSLAIKQNSSSYIEIRFNDYTYEYNKSTTLTDDRINSIRSTLTSVKQNLKLNYKLRGLDRGGIEITIDGNAKIVYDAYKSDFENLYKELKNYKEKVRFKFLDKNFYLNYEHTTFERYLGK